jgi:hypothetical protein
MGRRSPNGGGHFFVARASTTKNHKNKRQYLPAGFFAELIKAKPEDAAGNMLVFPRGNSSEHVEIQRTFSVGRGAVQR